MHTYRTAGMGRAMRTDGHAAAAQKLNVHHRQLNEEVGLLYVAGLLLTAEQDGCSL